MMTMGRGTTPESKLNEILEKRRENEQVLESTGTKARAFCFTAQRQRPDASRINKWYTVGQQFNYAAGNWQKLFDGQEDVDDAVSSIHTPYVPFKRPGGFRWVPTPSSTSSSIPGGRKRSPRTTHQARRASPLGGSPGARARTGPCSPLGAAHRSPSGRSSPVVMSGGRVEKHALSPASSGSLIRRLSSLGTPPSPQQAHAAVLGSSARLPASGVKDTLLGRGGLHALDQAPFRSPLNRDSLQGGKRPGTTPFSCGASDIPQSRQSTQLTGHSDTSNFDGPCTSPESSGSTGSCSATTPSAQQDMTHPHSAAASQSDAAAPSSNSPSSIQDDLSQLLWPTSPTSPGSVSPEAAGVFSSCTHVLAAAGCEGTAELPSPSGQQLQDARSNGAAVNATGSLHNRPTSPAASSPCSMQSSCENLGVGMRGAGDEAAAGAVPCGTLADLQAHATSCDVLQSAAAGSAELGVAALGQMDAAAAARVHSITAAALDGLTSQAVTQQASNGGRCPGSCSLIADVPGTSAAMHSSPSPFAWPSAAMPAESRPHLSVTEEAVCNSDGSSAICSPAAAAPRPRVESQDPVVQVPGNGAHWMEPGSNNYGAATAAPSAPVSRSSSSSSHGDTTVAVISLTPAASDKPCDVGTQAVASPAPSCCSQATHLPACNHASQPINTGTEQVQPQLPPAAVNATTGVAECTTTEQSSCRPSPGATHISMAAPVQRTTPSPSENPLRTTPSPSQPPPSPHTAASSPMRAADGGASPMVSPRTRAKPRSGCMPLSSPPRSPGSSPPSLLLDLLRPPALKVPRPTQPTPPASGPNSARIGAGSGSYGTADSFATAASSAASTDGVVFGGGPEHCPLRAQSSSGSVESTAATAVPGCGGAGSARVRQQLCAAGGSPLEPAPGGASPTVPNSRAARARHAAGRGKAAAAEGAGEDEAEGEGERGWWYTQCPSEAAKQLVLESQLLGDESPYLAAAMRGAAKAAARAAAAVADGSGKNEAVAAVASNSGSQARGGVSPGLWEADAGEFAGMVAALKQPLLRSLDLSRSSTATAAATAAPRFSPDQGQDRRGMRRARGAARAARASVGRALWRGNTDCEEQGSGTQGSQSEGDDEFHTPDSTPPVSPPAPAAPTSPPSGYVSQESQGSLLYGRQDSFYTVNGSLSMSMGSAGSCTFTAAAHLSGGGNMGSTGSACGGGVTFGAWGATGEEPEVSSTQHTNTHSAHQKQQLGSSNGPAVAAPAAGGGEDNRGKSGSVGTQAGRGRWLGPGRKGAAEEAGDRHQGHQPSLDQAPAELMADRWGRGCSIQ